MYLGRPYNWASCVHNSISCQQFCGSGVFGSCILVPVPAEIFIRKDLQILGIFGIQNKSIYFGRCELFDHIFIRFSIRSSWVLREPRSLVIGAHHFGGLDILEKFRSPNFSMVVKASVKIGGRILSHRGGFVLITGVCLVVSL